jgi:hypothetical protein
MTVYRLIGPDDLPALSALTIRQRGALRVPADELDRWLIEGRHT